MEITIKAFPKAKINKIVQVNPKYFKIYTTKAPEKNKANLEIIKMLADHFNIPKSQIILNKGETCQIKIFTIPNV